MKFSLFTEIQCPTGTSPDIRLNEFLEQAELADRLGFYGFWIAENSLSAAVFASLCTLCCAGGDCPTDASIAARRRG
jgi:alkanesulfonate monooxygenase SsuD/methylene tetrahydromethanopterin reductase-like flavin-dependent oxidoreductase (luciferase family)